MQINWQNENKYNKNDVEKRVGAWLFYRDSMTARLQSCCQNQLTVNVLSHQWQLPRRDDCHYLNLPGNEYVVVREVVLSCADTPYIYARTIIPENTVNNVGDALLALGDRPLGEVLFADPNLTRSELELAELSVENTEFQAAVNSTQVNADTLWARRSIFYLAGKGSLGLTEVFLPQCWQM